MRPLWPPDRNVLAAMTAVALVVLAVLAFRSTGQRNQEIRRMEVDVVQRDLAQQVAAWEAQLQADLDDAIVSVEGGAGTTSQVQARLQRRYPWLDRVYVWSAAEGEAGAPVWHFPVPEATVSSYGSCARELIASPPGEDVAAAFQAACGGAGLPDRVASAEALATQLLHDARFDDALRVVTGVGVPITAPLTGTTGRGVPVPDAIGWRLTWVQLLLETGRLDDGRREVARVVGDVASLDAPQAEGAIHQVQARLALPVFGGVRVQTLQRTLRAAEQRVEAWQALQALAAIPGPDNATQVARFVPDPFGDNPWSLYVRPATRANRGIAVQLNNANLISSFEAVLPAGMRSGVVLLDPSQQPAGSVRDTTVVPSNLRFSLALAHLRPALTERYVDQRVRPLLSGWMTWTNFVVVVCIILGFGALAAFVAADRQHAELLRRQKEFTTRVTHELKTPLAGIKVMAENIGAGAYKDDAHRSAMADRIVAEADRLTARVNEVLHFAGRQELPTIAPFDLDEILLELVDEWGPRYENAGVQLFADVDLVDMVKGDARAVRDAVACLLDNALKYRREDVDSQVWLNARQTDDAVEIEVLDNGLGVPAADRKRIFERFARVEGDNRGKAGGHGLGLAQVDAIVRAHRGTVSCADGVDGGARFLIRLPASA